MVHINLMLALCRSFCVPLCTQNSWVKYTVRCCANGLALGRNENKTCVDKGKLVVMWQIITHRDDEDNSNRSYCADYFQYIVLCAVPPLKFDSLHGVPVHLEPVLNQNNTRKLQSAQPLKIVITLVCLSLFGFFVVLFLSYLYLGCSSEIIKLKED